MVAQHLRLSLQKFNGSELTLVRISDGDHRVRSVILRNGLHIRPFTAVAIQHVLPFPLPVAAAAAAAAAVGHTAHSLLLSHSALRELR